MTETADRVLEAVRPYALAYDNSVIMIVTVIFLACVFVLFRGKHLLAGRMSSFFSNKIASGGENGSDSTMEVQHNIILTVVGCLSLGLIFTATALTYEEGRQLVEPSPVGFLLKLSLWLMMVVVARGMVYSFVNWVFFDREPSVRWKGAYYFLISLSALILYPLAMLKVFLGVGNTVVTICLLGLIITHKLLLFCKMFVNFRPRFHGSLLFFLYFCSVEILPTLVVWQLLFANNVYY